MSLFDFVLTDSRDVVPFASRQGRLLFLERVGQILLPPEPDDMLVSKDHMLSILLPAKSGIHGMVVHRQSWAAPRQHQGKRIKLLNEKAYQQRKSSQDSVERPEPPVVPNVSMEEV